LPPLAHRQTIQRILAEEDPNGYKEYGGRGLIAIDSEAGTILYNQFHHVRSEDGEPAGPEDAAATIRLQSIHDSENATLGDRFPSGAFATDYTWHSHPNGSWKRDSPDEEWLTSQEYDRRENRDTGGGQTLGGGPMIKSFDIGPSVRDIQNAHNRFIETESTPPQGANVAHPLQDNYVIHTQVNNGKVYYYNQRTEIETGEREAVINLEDFYTLHGTKK
ncbi:MAG: hypothetical protein ACPG5W_01675, partial [Flavobacteriales bacterium]